MYAIKEITLEIKNLNQIDYLKNFLKDEGTTKVRLNFRDKKNNYFFELNKNRKITRQNINELKRKFQLLLIKISLVLFHIISKKC